MTVYVRWQKDQPREGRVVSALQADHPSYLDPCANPGCDEILGDGTPVQLLAVGPEPDKYEDHQAGCWYSAVAVIAHARCLGTGG